MLLIRAADGLHRQDPDQRRVHLRREQSTKRNRRLAPREEAALLAVAGDRLQRLIIAALESGCRLGELLKLQTRDLDLARREMTIRTENAKDGEQRVLPISNRLAAVLEMATLDLAGQPLPPDGFVFGDGTGQRVKSPKRAWATCVLKAHGCEPQWTTGGKLAPASCAELRRIDLRFHDLRHEAGSRLIEGGWPGHRVQEILGHASLTQTSTYLNITREGLHESMRKIDEARTVAHPLQTRAK